jgi:hypothetical protein
VVGGNCVRGAGAVSCDLEDIPGGATREIELTLRGDTIGSNSVSASVSATEDSRLTNNSGDGTIIIDPEADLAIDLATPEVAVTGTNFTATFTVTNLGAIASDALSVDIELPANVTATSAVAAGMPCTIQAALVRCNLSSLSANGTAAGSVSLTAQSAGATQFHAKVTGTYVDPNAANDSADRTVTVSDSVVHPSTSTSTGGGGGGSTGPIALLCLAVLAIARGCLDCRQFRYCWRS